MPEQPAAGLGVRIRKARKAAGLSQYELAELLGVVQGAVSQWERGQTEPSLRHFIRMVRLLGPSLLELDDEEPPDEAVTGSRPGAAAT